MTEIVVIGSVGGILSIFVAIIAIVRSMTAPVAGQIENLSNNIKEDKLAARAELDKAERGLKEQTIRVEGIIRQTVEDVDNKLRREAELIEEKSKIQFQDQQRQLEQLRELTEQMRVQIWEIRNGAVPKAEHGKP